MCANFRLKYAVETSPCQKLCVGLLYLSHATSSYHALELVQCQHCALQCVVCKKLQYILTQCYAIIFLFYIHSFHLKQKKQQLLMIF